MACASSYKDPEVLDRLYWDEQLSTYQIAERFDVTPRTILNWMERLEIERRTPHQERPPSFLTSERGYERWEHEYDGEQWNVSVHRLLAVAEYGVDAVRDRDIHHRNQVPWDNRPGNVEPIDPTEHGRHHANQQ